VEDEERGERREGTGEMGGEEAGREAERDVGIARTYHICVVGCSPQKV
jgi:hypothetical protein